jgi:hypothetical protein
MPKSLPPLGASPAKLVHRQNMGSIEPTSPLDEPPHPDPSPIHEPRNIDVSQEPTRRPSPQFLIDADPPVWQGTFNFLDAWGRGSFMAESEAQRKHR